MRFELILAEEPLLPLFLLPHQASAFTWVSQSHHFPFLLGAAAAEKNGRARGE